MSVIIGAIVGAVVTLAMTVGVFFLSTVVPQLGACNCGCCLWPIIGGLIGAAVAIKMAGEGGAGKGVAVGVLTGILDGGALCVLAFVGVGMIVSQLPNMWGQIRTKITDEQVDNMQLNIPDEKLKADIKQFIKDSRKHENFKDAFKGFQQWLTDERIEAIVAQSKPEEKEKTRKTLAEFRTLNFDEAMKKLEPIIDDMKIKMVANGIFFAFLLCGAMALMGLFGGLIGGAIFAVDSGPKPPPQPQAA